MKILVTGAAGFVGSHLCGKLLGDGHEIIGLDNLSTGNTNNLRNMVKEDGFTFILHDICKPIHLKADQIYNLACPASPTHYQANPIHTLKTSTLGVINMLGLAKVNNACLLQTSTSEVYGDPNVSPQAETYHGNVNTMGPRSCYDEGKRCAETLCFDYRREHGLKTKVIRIFNTYGPKMHPNDGRVVSNFIVQALLNKPLSIYGDGSQTRSFQYIDDLVDGMISMMNNSKDFGGPINIGNPNEFTISELAIVVLKLTGSKSTIEYKELPEDDPKIRKPDISLALKELNWKPKICIEDGLRRTIEYFRGIDLH